MDAEVKSGTPRADRIARRPQGRKPGEAGWARRTVGTASRIAHPVVEELIMLTLTDSAVAAICSLTSQPELPAETGLRIMAPDEGAPSFQLALAEAPAAGDQVVEEGGARVFVEAAAAAALQDKELDAQVNEQGDVAFSVTG